MKIFQESGFHAQGNVLSLEDFRLFRDLDEVKLDEKKAKRLIADAEDLLENYEITTITLTMYRQYFLGGNMSDFSSPYQQRGRAMFTLGLAEAIERQGRFTEKLIDVLWAILEETTWVLPQHSGHTPMGSGTQVPPVVGDRYLHGIELGSAYRTAAMAVVYYYCKDIIREVSPVIADRMVYEMKKRTILPFISANFSWSGAYDGKCNNWCPWNVSNILLTTALIEENMAVREQVVEKSMQLLDNFVGNYMPDGGCNEGATYWKAAGGSLFDCLETLYDLTGGKLDLYDNELVRKMGEFEAAMNISGTNFVNFADGAPSFLPPANLLMRFGKKCGSPVLESFGKYMATREDYDVAYAHSYRSLRSLYTPSSEGEMDAPKAFIANHLPYLKVATFRDSEVANEGMFVAIKGGHNRESHNHNDVGNFIIYKNGNPVIIDAGVGKYTRDTFGPRRYTIWTMQSLYHNLAQFDGVGEKEGQLYQSRDEIFNDLEKSYQLQLAGAYPSLCQVKDYTRKIQLNDGVVTLTDKIELEEEKDIDFVLLTHRRPEEKDGKLILAEGCVLTYSDELAYECEEFDPTGIDGMARWGTPVIYRLHFRTRNDKCEYTFVIDGN